MTNNQIRLEGNLCSDCEEKMKGARFRLAVSSGNSETEPLYIDVILFSSDPEQISLWASKLIKGAHVVVDGRLSYRSGRNENGKYYSFASVVADTVKIIAASMYGSKFSKSKDPVHEKGLISLDDDPFV